MGISSSGTNPDSRISVRAMSSTLICSPMSRTNTSPPLAIAGGVHDELHGLGNKHEEAAHVGVGDGDGPAGLDLLQEPRYDTPVAAQYIAKAHGSECGLRRSVL